VFLPCPLKAARADDFDFSQWFARIVFPRYFFNPCYAMFEDLILPSNVPSVVASALFRIFLVHQFLGFAYFHREKGLPSVVLSHQFLEGRSEMEKSQPLRGFACSSFDLILGFQWRSLRERSL